MQQTVLACKFVFTMVTELLQRRMHLAIAPVATSECRCIKQRTAVRLRSIRQYALKYLALCIPDRQMFDQAAQWSLSVYCICSIHLHSA
jgi:hypothetical protein